MIEDFELTVAFVAFAVVAVSAVFAFIWYFPRMQARKTRGVAITDLPALENEYRKTILQLVGGTLIVLSLALAWAEFKESRQQFAKQLEIMNDQLEMTREVHQAEGKRIDRQIKIAERNIELTRDAQVVEKRRIEEQLAITRLEIDLSRKAQVTEQERFEETVRSNQRLLDLTAAQAERAKAEQEASVFIQSVEKLDNKALLIRVAAISAVRDLALKSPEEFRQAAVEVLSFFIKSRARAEALPSLENRLVEEEGKVGPHRDHGHTSTYIYSLERDPQLSRRIPEDVDHALSILLDLTSPDELNLEGVGLRYIDFTAADLNGLDLSFSDLSESFFIEAKMVRAKLKYAKLYKVKFSRADLSLASLTHADLTRAYLISTNLSGANLHGATLIRAHAYFADLRNANLSFSVLKGVSFSNANLENADLRHANLEWGELSDANFRGADLSNANLSNADLTGADFTGADLSSANFADSDLGLVMLSGANLQRAVGLSQGQIDKACVDDDTILPSSLQVPQEGRSGCVW